jgi:U1 small nuclear ribonucleoprotein
MSFCAGQNGPFRCAAGKPRGYAFIEYEHKKDMKEAYKAADGRKLEGRRILVDVERGRTVENW